MKKYLLSYDLGTSGAKVALFNIDGTMVTSYIGPYETFNGDGGVREQDSNAWWEQICETTKKIVAEVDKDEIAAVSFGGMGHCCVCVDEQGNALDSAIIWSDYRSFEQQQQLEESYGAKKCYLVTGHKLSTTYTITKMMWMKQHKPEIYNKTYKVLTAKDVIIQKLTGIFCTDYTDASGYMAYNYRTKKWEDEMIEAAGLKRSLFPDIVSGLEVVGTVHAKAAAACGLAEGTPVVPGAMDGSVAGIGGGSITDTSFYLGTSSGVALDVSADVVDPEERYEAWPSIDPNVVTLAGSMNNFGGSIAWMRKNLCAEEEQIAKETGRNVYDLINESVAKSPVGAKGLLFLPYLQGERSPYFSSHAKGVFIGLTSQHTANDMKRAVMEGAALHLGMMMNQIVELSGAAHPKTATIAGGSAKGHQVCQIMADVFDCKMMKTNVSDEVGSLGAALCAGVGIGVFDSLDVANKFVKVTETVEPIKENVAVYKEKVKVFEQAYKLIEPIFPLLKE